MTNYQDDYLCDYLAGLCIVTGLAVLILAPAVLFVTTGHWAVFFSFFLFGKFAAWIVTAPFIDDEED